MAIQNMQITLLRRNVVSMTALVLTVMAAASLPTAGAEAGLASPNCLELVEARKIWEQAPHNAFTDLLRAQDRWWCVFREGQKHVSRDGSLRVLTSVDGKKWESAALVKSDVADLRDPKITLTPDGQFMMNAAGALHKPAPSTHQSFGWFSKNGRDWSEPTPVGDPNFWLWRVSWNQGVCYGVGYECSKQRTTRLYQSRDGRQFSRLVEEFYKEGGPNESSILFLSDQRALCLLRRDPGTGLLGSAKPPYKDWEWQDLKCRIGGPHLLRLPDGRLLAAVRLYDGKVRTALCWLDPQEGKLTEALALPSGGDTSYAGLAWHEGQVWVSYYSSHEGKTAIYLAKVKCN